MTMPANVPAPRVIELPTAQPPIVLLVVMNPIFQPENGAVAQPLMWAKDKAHPLVDDAKIVRMHFDLERGGIAVYSLSRRGDAMRDLIPMHNIRLVEEGMPLDVFIDELDDAESLEEDPDDDAPNGEGEPDADEPQTTSNDQNAATS